ncbi:MAG: class I SAM-dependent methyltransferase [Deltaproteobacteria bacterium]|nr:MAG: class I SAM-dependent methyltransferase [Deltaproteobacteria bacterium]
MRQRALYVAVFAACFALILLEITYTRILSFKVYYYFTYFTIGIALLGLGAGGVWVSVHRELRAVPLERLVPVCCAAGAAAVLAGYLVIAWLPLNVSHLFSEFSEVAKLTLAALCLFAPFLAVGVVLAAVFGSQPERVNRLYAVDLLGAGVGCTASIPLMQLLTPPGCVMLGGLLLAAAGLPLAARGGRGLLGAGAAVAGLLLAALAFRGDLPDPVTDRLKHLSGWRDAGLVRYSQWSPIFRVDVADHPQHPELSYAIHHDGQLGSALYRFDGDLTALERFRADPRAYPFAVTNSDPRVLVIGAAGGHEVLVSLYFGAARVVGVELNPVTLSLVTDRYADFVGRIHEDERVSLVLGEGRSYLSRSEQEFDLIWLVAPDSYAAMNAASSAAFVLTESYLYTVEMIRESLDHLGAGGILCVQFGELDYEAKPNRTARYVSTARRALSEAGFADPSRHILVATASDIPPFVLSTVLIGKEPFGEDQIQRFVERSGSVSGGVTRYAPGRALDGGPVNRVIDAAPNALAELYAAHPYDVTPVYDEAPFFWHFARFRDAFGWRLSTPYVIDWEDAIGERVLLVLAGLVTVLAGLFLLVPFAVFRPVWRSIPYRAATGVYFASLGFGFMLVEVCLIQMLTLFLGYPTRSLSVTLFGLLIFAGLGSLASGAYARHRNRALVLLLAALALLLGFYQLGLPGVVDRFAGAPLGLRMGLAVALVAPLGLCLGAFLPLGLRSVAALTSHAQEYVAWSWAVNGFFSVLSSIVGVILAMMLGFNAVLLIALAAYAVGVTAMARIPVPAERRAGPGAEC